MEGTAFGKGPIKKSEMPSYQGDVGGEHGARGQFPRLRARRFHCGQGQRHRQTHQPRIHHRTQLSSRFWIGGGKARPNSRFGPDVVRGRQAGATARRTGQQRDDAGNILMSAPRPAKRRGWKFSMTPPAAGATSASAKLLFTDHLGRTANRWRNWPDFGTMSLALLGERADRPALTRPRRSAKN